MLYTASNMLKYGFSLIRICQYIHGICDSVHKRENADAILIQMEKLRPLLRVLVTVKNFVVNEVELPN